MQTSAARAAMHLKLFCAFSGTSPSFLLIGTCQSISQRALGDYSTEATSSIAHAVVSLCVHEYDTNHVRSSFARSQHAPCYVGIGDESSNDECISFEPDASLAKSTRVNWKDRATLPPFVYLRVVLCWEGLHITCTTH